MKKTDLKLFFPLVLTIGIFLVPFAWSSNIPNGYIAPKTHLFNALAICFALYSIIANLALQRKLLINLTDIVIVALFTVCLASYLRSSIHGYNENLVLLGLSILVTLLLKQFEAEHSSFSKLALLSFMATVIGQAIYGQAQLLGFMSSNNANFTLTGSFHNPGPFGIYLSIGAVCSAAIICFTGTVTRLERILRGMAYASLGLGISIIPATQSRTAWVSLFIGIAFVLAIKICTGFARLATKFNAL